MHIYIYIRIIPANGKKKNDYTIMYNEQQYGRWKQWILKGKETIAYIVKENNTWHEIIIEHGI